MRVRHRGRQYQPAQENSVPCRDARAEPSNGALERQRPALPIEHIEYVEHAPCELRRLSR